MIRTTHGLKEESELARTLGFEEHPNEFIVWIEWRMSDHAGCDICEEMTRQHPMFAPREGVVLVKRSAHVILKEASVETEVLAGVVNG